MIRIFSAPLRPCSTGFRGKSGPWKLKLVNEDGVWHHIISHEYAGQLIRRDSAEASAKAAEEHVLANLRALIELVGVDRVHGMLITMATEKYTSAQGSVSTNLKVAK